MFGNIPTNASPNRIQYQQLLKTYRRPCFYGNVNVPLTVKFIGELINLYNKIYEDIPPNEPFCDLDVVIKEIISDINFEINTASRKANLDFRFVQTRLKSKNSIKEWETIKGSHALC